MEITYLPFNNDELPCKKTFELGNENYSLAIRYNDRFDFYSAELYDNDETLLFSGKLTYLEDYIDSVVENIDSSVKVVPIIIDDVLKEYPTVTRISSDNFDDVRLCVEIF